jgi:hypothetical protein
MRWVQSRRYSKENWHSFINAKCRPFVEETSGMIASPGKRQRQHITCPYLLGLVEGYFTTVKRFARGDS